MSPDRVVYSFVVGWVVLLAILIALDWLGNPNRGSFRPKGERPPRDRATRRAERIRRRLEEDASVRAALRDAYGASSLRLTWTGDHETRARQLDDALIVDEIADAVDVESREVATIDRTIVTGDPLPNVAEAPPARDEHTEEPEDGEDGEVTEVTADTEITADGQGAAADADDVRDPEPDPPSEEPAPERPRGWTVGTDPLALTAKGAEPAPATVRTRVWKNHGADGAWTEENRERLVAGKAPRRVNPITGRNERAVVDVDTGRATWGSDPVDPFEVEP